MSLTRNPEHVALLSILNRAANPMAVIDADGSILAVNQPMAGLLGDPGTAPHAPGAAAAGSERPGPAPSTVARIEAPPNATVVHLDGAVLTVDELPDTPGWRLLSATAPRRPGGVDLAPAHARAIVDAEPQGEAHRTAAVGAAFGAAAWEWHPASGDGRWAPAHLDLFGITSDQPFIPTWRSRVHPEDLPRVNASVARCLASGGDQVEYRYHHPTRGLRWMISRGARLPDDPERIAGVTLDITEEHEVDVAVRDSEAHLRRVLDTLASFVGVTLPDGTLVEANRAPLEAAGLRSADVLGRPFEQTYWWSYDPEVQAQLRAAIDRAAAGEGSRYDVWVRAVGDSRLMIDFRIAPVFDETGRVTHLVPSAVDVTERVRIQEALRESEQRLQRALEAAMAGTFDIDVATGRASVSASTNRLFGLPDDTRGTLDDYVSRIHPDDIERVRAEIAQSITGVRRQDIDYRVQLPGGSVRWVDSRAEPLTDAQGRVVRLVGTLIDVTARRLAELNVRESEERFRVTFDLAAVGLAHVGPDGRWLRVNDRLCEITGYGREQLLELTFQAITHPDDLALDLAQAERLLAGEISTYTLEKRYVRPDGSSVWVELRGSIVRHADGSPHYFVAAVQDISERKRADETIRRQLSEIEAIYQLAGVGLAVFDRELRFVRVNERMAAMNGLAVADHIGRTVREVVPDLADQAEPAFRRVIETGEAMLAVEVSGTNSASGDTTRTRLENWVPILGRSGDVVGVSVTAEDITERRKVDQLRDTFIGMLSHELRTPMTGLYAASQLLLRRRGADGHDAELIDEVAAGAERLHRIVENLLVLARVERGLALPGAEPVLLQRVLPGVVESERRLWPGQRIELVPLPPDLPPVRSDVDALGQVIRNLVSNAAKYGGGGGRIQVRVARRPRAVSIRVLDEGPGLGSVEPARLFDIYYRTEDAARRAPGAGIGLFVCRALVEGMGGRIRARNRPGGGAEFSVSLPVFHEPD